MKQIDQQSWLESRLQQVEAELNNVLSVASTLEHERNEARAAARRAEAESKRLYATLKFYADPNTYFAIGFFPDPPCGELMDDFSETELGEKPGRRAREALGIDV